MQITDPIADLLTRIRNASTAKHPSVEIPASNMKKAIAEILLEEGYIKNYQVTEDDRQGMIKVTLKYGENKAKVILLSHLSNSNFNENWDLTEVIKNTHGIDAIIDGHSGVLMENGLMTNKKGTFVPSFVYVISPHENH